MVTYQQRQDFEAEYSFVEFQQATGYMPPQLGLAYDNFREFTIQYIKDNGFGAISEAFEAWARINLNPCIRY